MKMPPVADSETPSMQDIHSNGYAGTNGRNKLMEGGMRLYGRCKVAEFVLNRLKLWNILLQDAKF